MHRIVGGALVILACAGIGYYMSTKLALQLKALQILKKLVIMLKGEILYMNAPLEEAFLSVAERLPLPFSRFLLAVSEDLGERSSRPFYEVWCEDADQHLKESNLSAHNLKELKEMGENLGYLDRQMQEKTLNLYLQQLEEEMEIQKSEFPQKSKIYRTLGVMGGIFITIVLI